MFAAALPAAHAQAPAVQATSIRIVVQRGNHSAIVYKVATERGFWAEARLHPSFQTFTAGAARIEAHERWDFGTVGAVPALVGAREYDLVTVAVANDEPPPRC